MAHRLNRRRRRQAEARELAEALALQEVWREQQNCKRVEVAVEKNTARAESQSLKAARAESQLLLGVWQKRENRRAWFVEQARLRANARKRRRRLRRVG